MYTEITQCRISGSTNLIPVLSLGNHALTGVFPKRRNDPVTTGPLELVWCPESELLQLRHSYDPKEMYGANYGYRSSLNRSMVNHLRRKVEQLSRYVPLDGGDLVVDIGSNDGTLLKCYPNTALRRIGMDPTGAKFRDCYTDGIELIADFFEASALSRQVKGQKAKIITSIAMFYDLESPLRFVEEVAGSLHPGGIWHFEQSYMPSMLRLNAYDTICHEHLEYYSLTPVRNLLETCGLKIVDVQMNTVNGGSFAVTAAHAGSRRPENRAVIDWMLAQEDRMGLSTPRPFRSFEAGVFEHRKNLVSLIGALNADGKKIVGYGASTKGNVLLQFCGFSQKEIAAIGDVNPDKFGAYTPGTGIPIVSEPEARALKPDYYLVLPWHFRDSIIEREKDYIAAGGKMIFPFPEIEIF
ncbi:MAG: class I SAM-dependent methyltransferase [Deltaproteobacteria bacterium]|nr:class I SAM-dependent methyltransferase [Deltaproteobacteria bacterium]